MPSSSSISSSVGNPDYGRGIWLKRFTQTEYRSNSITGFRFKVVAYGGNLMPDKIFRYAREALNAREGAYRLAFDGVCSPSDLEEFPEDEPLVNVYPEFCRLDYVDLVFRSQSLAEEAWQLLTEEVAALVNTLNKMDTTTPQTELKFGDPPPTIAPTE
jgi:hypothetical protein